MSRTPTNIGLCNVFFYVLLPVSLCAAILFRYDFIGIVYLLLLLTWPYNTGYNTAYAKRFTLTTLIFSCIFSLLECIFLAVVAIKKTEFLNRDADWELGYCSKTEEVYRFLGMQALDQATAVNIIRILVPNFVVFIISLLTYLNLCAIKAKGSHQGSQETQLIPGNPGQSQTFLGETITDQTLETKSRWNKFLFLFTLVFLALSGIASPSALSFPYLLLFLFLTTMYSFHVNLEPQRNVYKLRLGLSIYTAFHLLLMYMWQLPSINSNSMEINKETNATDLASRVLGLKRLVIVDCTIPNPCGTNTTINNITTVRPVPIYDIVVDNCAHEECIKPYCWQNETPDFFEPMFVLLLHFCCAYSYMIFRDFKSSQKAYYSHLSQRSAAYIQEADPLVDATSTFSDTEIQDNAYPVPEPSAKSPTSAVLHRMSIFKSRLPQKRQIWIALREKVLYVVGLIMMMAWSVTYHSWITFILLLWSCYLWMARDRASVTLRHSKYITLYAIVLILLQFVYSLRLTDDELPTKLHDNDKGEKASDGLKTIGLSRPEGLAFTTLLLRIGFTLVFWLMIHENIRQKFEKQRPNAELPMPEIQAWILEQLARYFIIIVSSFLLFIALNGQVVGYKIIYMLFFLFSGVIFQLSWNMWHRVLRVFWLLLVVYSILVVVLIYTFQLNGFQDYWKNITTLTTSDLEDIGLKYYKDSSGLMMSIFLPTAFLVCCMLQLHYYHERFIVLTDEHTDDRLQNGPLLSRTRYSRRRSDSFLTKNTKWRQLYTKLSVFAEIFKRIMWKLLEIHRWKICAMVVILSALSQPSACYLFPALLWILGLPFRNLDLFVYILTLVWASLMLLFNMIYQLEFVHVKLNQTLLESTNCHDENLSGDLMKWIGFEKVEDKNSFCEFVRGWLSIIIVLLAERVIFRRSRFLENHYPETKVAPGAVFPEIIRENADRSVKECCKFFANYFFHKFGVEICFISSVITIWTRKDFFGTIYAIWLLVLLVLSSNSRRTLAKVWKGYTIFLAVLWAVEFVLVLNIPKALCIDLKAQYYNNEKLFFVKLISDEDERIKFIKFLFLPLHSGIDEDKASAIILDFFQLLLAVCQCGVFETENTDTWIKLAGRNDDTVLDDVKDNPHRNFILAEPPTTLDRLKTFVFSMVYWVTFTVVLIAGTNRTSLFCLGYLVASFYFLYQGQMIITCRPSILRRRWNWLLFYTGTVVVTKCCLQLLACVFSGTVENIDGNSCYLRSLLSLSCEETSYFKVVNADPPKNECIHEKDVQAVGIAWDFATFIFLLLQRRIFQSYYFLHVREDLIVQIGLSSKGNQLFSMWVQMEAGKRKKNEEIDKERVQESVERIRKNVRSDMKEPYDHFDALRVCDKTWFEGLTETIDLDDVVQAPHGLPQSTSDSGLKSTPGIPHSITDNQLSAAGNSPKLPQSFRDIKQGIGNVLFTGRLPGKDMSESKDTLFERTQQADKEQSPKLQSAGRAGRVDWTDDAADRVFKSVSYDKTDHIVAVEEDSSMSEPITSPGEAPKTHELTVAVSKEEFEAQGNLLYDTVVYLTRVLNTRTQAYRSIIIQLKRDRQESRNTLPVVADRRYAHQIRNAALNRVARHGAGSNAGSHTGTDLDTPPSSSRTHQDDFANYFVSPDDFDKGDHFIQRLLSAIWYFVQFQIDNLCYALMILNGMLNASILSIPMLGMVFLWAMLSVPRPSKRFWVTVIGYTCIVITIKYIFAFKVWAFNQEVFVTEEPFAIQKIFGVENRDGVKYLDIAQLLVLFFQRGLLKVHGLWENYDERDLDDEDDNTNLFQVYIVDKTIDGFGRLVGRNKSKRKEKNSRPRTTEQNKNCFLRVIDWALNKLLVFFKSPGRFYARLIQQEKEKKNMPTDMYIWMLGCDFICFIIIMFGYWAFGKHTIGQTLDITVQIKENTVPKSFLYLLITHFFLILVDRAIYLKKNLMAKLLFHFAQVLVIHIWIFFLLPQITSRSFFKNNVAISLYTFKAIYFAFSAHQIKSGYPTRILQHFLTKRYNYVNLYVFIGYRVCPFIIEFQNIMDWMFVESTVGISRWFMLTTIYHELYQIKCWRHLEKQFHYPRGFPRWPSFKYSGGGLLIVLLIIIMWFPLAFMSIVQTVAGIANAPKEVKVSLSLEGFSEIFTDYSVGKNLRKWEEEEFKDLNKGFIENLGAQQMLSRYDHGDLFSVKVNKNSDTIWSITEPQRQNMINLLSQRSEINNQTTSCGAWFVFDYRIRRNPNQYNKLYEFASGEAKHLLSLEECDDFKAVLEGESPNLNVTINKAIPHYIRALNTDTAREMTGILNADINTKLWANLTLSLQRKVTVLRVCESATDAYKINGVESCQPGETEHTTVKEEKWWSMTTLGKLIPTDPESDDLVDELIIISDKTGPESLAWLTGYGVIGLYLSVVLLAGRYTRAIFQYDGAYIMFHEYPNVDELLQLCSDIYLVRELKEWKLEEDLMAKLIYLYRSPETMLRVTKLRPYKPKLKQIKQD